MTTTLYLRPSIYRGFPSNSKAVGRKVYQELSKEITDKEQMK